MKEVVWTKIEYNKFMTELYRDKDEKYRSFQQKLIFTQYPIVGIRAPKIRLAAKKIARTDLSSFLEIKSTTYEETLLYGLVLGSCKDETTFDHYFPTFVSITDNWATCDMGCPSFKIVAKNRSKYWNTIRTLLSTNQEFPMRIGIILLMSFYLEDEWIDRVFSLLDQYSYSNYYTQMAVAWLLSVALVSYYEKTLNYLKQSKLDTFTYHKALQKARESYRITKEQKEYLKTLKRS